VTVADLGARRGVRLVDRSALAEWMVRDASVSTTGAIPETGHDAVT